MTTVESYKLAFGKSFVDQKMLIPEQYQDLVWFLYPSEVLSELLSLKKGTLSMAALKSFAECSSQTGDFTTPFIPKDYNKFTYTFAFSRDTIAGDEFESTEDSCQEDKPSEAP